MYEEHHSNSPLIHCLWRATVDREGAYDDPASEYWNLAFTRHANGNLSAVLAGPSTASRHLEMVAGEDHWGVEFNAHVVMKHVNKVLILGAIARVPVKSNKFIAIADKIYGIPSYDELEAFVLQLKEDGALKTDPAIEKALLGDEAGLSERTRQRKYRRTTGLSKKQIDQLARARHAFYLLQQGYSLAKAAAEAGYADQAHMTRSFQLLRSETPAKIIARHLDR